MHIVTLNFQLSTLNYSILSFFFVFHESGSLSSVDSFFFGFVHASFSSFLLTGSILRRIFTGEKMELDGYNVVEGAYTSIYNHQGNNQLCTIVAMNKEAEAAAHGVAMQIAAMNPIAIDEAGVPESVKEAEIQVAIDKTKKEQVDKAVEAALKKAGINPAHVDSEDHMESNKAKGWITDEDIAKAKEIIATVSAEKAANLPEAMIQNIAKGRLGKFLKEVCLLNQEDIMDGKKTVREVLKEIDPELQIVDFKRFTLRAE